MKNRGLCSTCVHDKDCIFPRKSSVWQCEEFSDKKLVTPKKVDSRDKNK